MAYYFISKLLYSYSWIENYSQVSSSPRDLIFINKKQPTHASCD